MLKPWPGDAIMIIAADFGTENRVNMEAVIFTHCRDCEQALAADLRTLRVAETHPVRKGRPVKFFCVRCCVKYDPTTISHFADHSAAQDGRAALLAANPNAKDIDP